MTAKNRLELSWIGKENRPRLEPRIFLADRTLSHHAATRKEGDHFDNILIRGDNLLALKALQSTHTSTVKCIYIDPPFNTGQAFDEYDDALEHSVWLGLMRDRLEVLKSLLSEDGSIWVEIDDTEMAYLQALLDEVFGRRNRIANVAVRRSAPTGHKAINPAPINVTDYVLAYAKDKTKWRYQPQVVRRDAYDYAYSTEILNAGEDHQKWQFGSVNERVARSLGYNSTRDARKNVGPEEFDIKVARYCLDNSDHIIRFAQPDYSAVSKDAQALIDASKNRPDEVLLLERANHPDMYFYRGNRILFLKDKLYEEGGETFLGEPLTNFWDDMSWQGIAREGGVKFPKNKKPERLLHRILKVATQPNDLVLDSFAGSGTTGAVAHKMRRRWIMVELGDHCESLIIPRLRSVINGTDSTGVSSMEDWNGGGGYRYFRLAPSLLEKDQFGNWVVSKSYNAEMLAEAMCKHFGFKYAPSDEHYWMQGHSSDSDFIYVTTASLTHEQLRAISQEVGDERTLLIACKAFQTSNPDSFSNLTLRKIPAAVLNRCEWGKDDYSLKIENLPMMEEVEEAEEDQSDLFPGEAAK
jgi:adenine-specific DNA-methyltransferase